MNLSAEQQNRLSRILSVELECARSLADILQRENSALKSRDPDRVLAISREKQQAVEQMQLSGRQREQLLASLIPAPGTEGTEALFQANPDAACTGLWRQLGEIAGQLREQNEINGGILALSQRHNKQALDILCGRTESRNTYGAKGQHHPDPSGHPLAKA
ncbi:flagella synthesis protein FlgN [Sedimenticola hydrogenitrophicus]|uniref:flagella synthesis protein FlgN n=1 Tax=Sedimenticola hydrogenitrophicus TaxID=2967975 RepID=UPI0021A4B20E|nr:flagellar protein FlgN [Sedimenticola hydrogenitrophicus]